MSITLLLPEFIPFNPELHSDVFEGGFRPTFIHLSRFPANARRENFDNALSEPCNWMTGTRLHKLTTYVYYVYLMLRYES